MAMQEPLLSTGPSRRASNRAAARQRGCFGPRCAAVTGIAAAFVLFAAGFVLGVTRNYYCSASALEGVEVPYGGEIIPAKVTLVERKHFFQFSKLVDVYDEDGEYVGYFYDINLFFVMRFGFSDGAGRVWFEARYASFLSRFKPILEYNLQRCDADGRTSELFELKEDWWAESWFCIYHCNRFFDLGKRETTRHIREGLLPPSDFPHNALARVVFDSRLTPTFRGKLTGTVERGGVGFRHSWWMQVLDSSTHKPLAMAKQRFVTGDSNADFDVLSRWNLTMTSEKVALPNWVISFLSVMDDIEEAYA
mmetsp:Transcript_21157/g.60469  ORF Transcript_21157/g.60469 Transcript_21157/m.60469 type:complete len:307 (-) Transcript_21157:115-1035(-)